MFFKPTEKEPHVISGCNWKDVCFTTNTRAAKFSLLLREEKPLTTTQMYWCPHLPSRRNPKSYSSMKTQFRWGIPRTACSTLSKLQFNQRKLPLTFEGPFHYKHDRWADERSTIIPGKFILHQATVPSWSKRTVLLECTVDTYFLICQKSTAQNLGVKSL